MAAGRKLSPIFAGNYFHFVTMPKHYDPELYFTFTYGDTLQSIRGKHNDNPTATPLKELQKGDILVLYAGFERAKNRTKRLIGIFAYICVDCLFIIDHKKKLAVKFWDGAKGFTHYSDNKQNRKTYSDLTEGRKTWKPNAGWNPHADPNHADWSKKVTQILICGDTEVSKMLSKVEILAALKNGRYEMSGFKARRWGLESKDYTRNMPRHVDKSKVDAVWRRLKHLP